jgi:hypothetical protein
MSNKIMKKQKPFKVIPGPFLAFKDEMATQEAMVEYVGGHHRAEQLSRIRQNSYPMPTYKGELSAKEVFRIRAKREGFTDMEVDAFESL